MDWVRDVLAGIHSFQYLCKRRPQRAKLFQEKLTSTSPRHPIDIQRLGADGGGMAGGIGVEICNGGEEEGGAGVAGGAGEEVQGCGRY